jgi:SAM-dependent methyltransferase
MCELPIASDTADVVLAYSGLHMVKDPEIAVQELGRCLKPGGKLIGCTLLAEGALRQRVIFSIGQRLGHAIPPHVSDLHLWFRSAGFHDTKIEPRRGLAFFHGTKSLG